MLLKKSKLFSIVVCMITVLSVLSLMIPRNVSADGNDKTLTLVCVKGNTVLPGVEWKIYKVGQRVANAKNFVQTGDFSGIQVNMKKLTPETVHIAAQTFQCYAIACQIKPLQTGVSNEAGEVQFSGLDAGLYLVYGKLVKMGSNYYQPAASLVELRDEDSELKYNAYPKMEYVVMNGQPVAHQVYKEWLADELHLDRRPDHVTVDIYRDEEYYETVTLSEENRWRYRWVDPDGSSSWLVMEKEVPENYEVNVECATNFRIQNSYTEEPFLPTTVPTGTTTTTTSISLGQVSTGNSITTTTTIPPQHSEYSRTRTTTSISLGQVSTGNSVTTTTTVPPQHSEYSRTRTTTATDISNGNATDLYSVTTATDISNGNATNLYSVTTATDVSNGNATNLQSITNVSTETTGSSTSSTTTRKPSSGGGSSSGNGGGSSGGKGNGSSGGNSVGKGSSGSTKLPQTGQLWWPVVPLSIGGVLCVSAGFAIRTRKKSDE